jgi:hypothetical protein
MNKSQATSYILSIIKVLSIAITIIFLSSGYTNYSFMIVIGVLIIQTVLNIKNLPIYLLQIIGAGLYSNLLWGFGEINMISNGQFNISLIPYFTTWLLVTIGILEYWTIINNKSKTR